jgi:TRAP-type C4-dicarboxylate transport system permease small subunit
VTRAIARVTRGLAALAALLLFATGAMLTYEVVARYFFNAPTIWAEELSRLFLIWAVFLASASLLRSGDHIRVTVLVEWLPGPLRKVLHAASLLFVAVIAGFVAWYGFPIAAKSFEVGRTTGSMLDIPQWWWQASIPFGFALIALEALLLSISVMAGGDDPFEGEPEAGRVAE